MVSNRMILLCGPLKPIGIAARTTELGLAGEGRIVGIEEIIIDPSHWSPGVCKGEHALARGVDVRFARTDLDRNARIIALVQSCRLRSTDEFGIAAMAGLIDLSVPDREREVIFDEDVLLSECKSTECREARIKIKKTHDGCVGLLKEGFNPKSRGTAGERKMPVLEKSVEASKSWIEPAGRSPGPSWPFYISLFRASVAEIFAQE